MCTAALAQSNPVLVVGTTSNAFTSYYTEIVRAEGFSGASYADLTTVNASVLASRDVVILGETPLTAAQVTMFADWVTAGGKLIAMRPDKQLAGLLGLTTTPNTLAEGYLLINTSQAPGAGLVSQTIQFHGTADRYTLSGATAVATLYSTSTVATANPAVTLRSVGALGGQAAAFTYDLARSIVYTRQGNPNWAGTERDGIPPVRSSDMFYGASATDPKPDYVDLSKVAIPQADEQQRLLANLILHMNLSKKPLPRLWYFPFGKKAAVVMTGDDHANGGTSGRFDSHVAASPSGCVVDNWECIRSTSYIYTNTAITPAQAQAYDAQGFELGVHVTTDCLDYTPSSIASIYASELAAFGAKYTTIPAPVTNRTHCIVFSDWSSQPTTEAANNIRLDTNYYYWPPAWVNNVPGFMTGSGLAMRFADLNGASINNYQAATQMTDESGQSFPYTSDTLLDRAIGPEGYYGFFVANIHTDNAFGTLQEMSDAVVASAKARNVPVISARQLLRWLDGREATSFTGYTWSGAALGFTISLGAGANGAEVMVPYTSASGSVSGVTIAGSAVTFRTETIKGVQYAIFRAANGAVVVNYSSSVVSVAVAPATASLSANQFQNFTATVTGAADTSVTWSISPSIGSLTVLNATSARYNAPATIASTTNVTVTATSVQDPTKSASAVVTLTPSGGPSSPSFTDTTATDFGAGTGASTYISEKEDGEVQSLPAAGAEFTGTALPTGWNSVVWQAGGAATVSGGAVLLNSARAGTDAIFTQGRVLEYSATFSTAAYQHAGLGVDLSAAPWAIFSTGAGGALFARSNDGTTPIETSLGATYLNSPHVYRIQWNAGTVVFSIDGVQVASHALNITATMRPMFSSYLTGVTPLAVQWAQLTPYTAPSTFTSRVFDAGAALPWGVVNWTATTPAGTALAMSVRTGNTPVPDGAWTTFNPVTSGGTVGATARYLQYQAQFTSSDAGLTASLRSITVNTTAAIGNVTSGNISSTGATLTWTTTAPSDSQTDYGTTASYGSTTPLDASMVTNHAVTLSGLTPNTLYHYRVKSRDAQGTLLVSDDFTFTTSPSSSIVITGIQAVGAGTVANITWTTDRASDSRVDFGATPSALPFVATGTSGSTAHAVQLTGLTPGVPYYFRVTSADSFGSSTSPVPPATLSFIPTDNVPPVISAITATPTATSAVIAWTTNELSNSRVNYGTSAGALNLSVNDAAMLTAHSVTLPGLTGNTTYYYTVTSTDASGNPATAPASPASFTTPDGSAPAITGVTVVPGLLGAATVKWTTNRASNSRIDYGTTAGSLLLNASDAAMTTAHTLRLTGLAQGQRYYFRLSSTDATSLTGVYPDASLPAASFVQNALSLWNASATPAVVSDADPSPVELGMKFTSTSAGTAVGIAFYKGAANTGTHTGTIWSATGTLLSTGTFTNESASGWQQLMLDTPVAIAANTTYIVSYRAPNGRYAVNDNFFATALTAGPLTAPASAGAGGNGTYSYVLGQAPLSSYNASNYWVDVVFLDNVAPAVSNVTATPAATSATITWNTSEAANALVQYGTSASNLNLTASASAFATAQNVLLSGLAANTTYYYRVVSADTAGNATEFPLTPAAPNSFTTTATVTLSITGVSAVAGSTSAIITWTTNVIANSRVDYGASAANLNLSANDAANVTAHSVTLNGLTPATTYYFRVTSTEPGGATITSPAAPQPATSFLTNSGSPGGGNPPSEWDISGSGDANLQGFSTEISYNVGETARFKIKSNASSYRIDIYRLGYYGGNGATFIATVNPSIALPQTQPNCLSEPSTGLIDCGNWAESASWAIPANAKSGVYVAKLVRQSGGTGSSHIVFVVRDDASTAQIVFQTSDTTWQAYNEYGGNSLYTGSPAGRAYKVSYNRPFITRGNSPQDWVFNAEYPMIRWLEANGYDVTYIAGVDTDRRGNLLTNHKIFMSVGHDEYWSGAQRTNVEAARAAGVHLAFLSGNEVFWKTRYENSISSPATAYRTLVCFKDTHANAQIDPTGIWTGTWRDPRFSPPADGGRPENALTGTIFTVNCCSYAITVPEAEGKMRFWRNTTIANLGAGQVATLPDGTLGYEWDEALNNGFAPPGLMKMSSTTVTVPERILDYGNSYGQGTSTHAITLYKHTSGALVFGAGTVQWSWGLDGNHDRGNAPADVRMQQATVNLLADMGVQPTTLQAGLLPAVKSTDTTGPTVTISSPINGATVTAASTITVSGTASDVGGAVASVEYSTDGGATWLPANGRGSWSFSWTTPFSGSATLNVRATDDSANASAAPAQVTVTVGAGTSCNPCSIWPSTTVPSNPQDTDTSAVELGVKFRASVAGKVTGVRFYKGAGNTGAHTGKLWSSTGTLLASLTFQNETASGWQEALFTTPVNVTANTTYVVSYWAPAGRYAADANFFTTQGVTNGPLTALQSGVDGLNGVFNYTGSAFPATSYQDTNYYADVLFVPDAQTPDTTPPVISGLTATPSGTQAIIAYTTNEAAAGVLNYGTAPGSLTLSQSSAPLTTSKSFTVTGLTAGTTYYYAVTATDAAGNAATSAVASFTAGAGDSTPPVVSSVTATPSSTSALVSWSTDETAQGRVTYGTSAANLSSVVTDTTLTTSKSLTLTGLTGGVTYYYRVVATDAAGNVTTFPAPPAAPLTFTTVFGVPNSTTIVTGTAAGGNAASLAADDNNLFQVGSTTTGTTRRTSYTGLIPNVPRTSTSLRLDVRTSSSGTCTQVISIYNYNSSSWVQLNSRSIGTTETTVANLSPSGAPSNFISGSAATGNVQFRVACSRTLQNFTHRSEFVRLSY